LSKKEKRSAKSALIARKKRFPFNEKTLDLGHFVSERMSLHKGSFKYFEETFDLDIEQYYNKAF